MQIPIFFDALPTPPENYETKTLCCLVLDCSASMAGVPIDELNNFLIQFKTDIEKDSILSDQLEIAIIAFDSNVKILQQPALINKVTIPKLIAGGRTSLNVAVTEAIRAVGERSNYYYQTNQVFNRPWIILITDGVSTDGDITLLGQRIKEHTRMCRYVFLPIGVNGADVSALKQLAGYVGSELVEPLPINNAKFSEFFRCFSISLRIREEVDLEVPIWEVPTWMSGFKI